MTISNRPRAILPATSFALGAAAATLALTGSLFAQTITLIPVSPSGSNCAMYAVNANGDSAVGYSNNFQGTDYVIWHNSIQLAVGIGNLPGGSTNSYGQAIDAGGSILAGYGEVGGSTRAFRWSAANGFNIIPLIPGTFFAQAFGISASGQRVAGTSGVGGVRFAFLWDVGNPSLTNNLGVLSGQTTSDGLAISGDGTTVTGFSGPFPIRWTLAGGVQGLGAPLPGQSTARGEAINTNGSVITGRYNNGSELGFRWTSAGGMVALPQSPGGSAALRPRGVSGDGNVIVGQVVDNAAGFTTFVWTPALGTQLLPAHLTARGVNLTGWQLTDATAISADGSAMCGIGTFGGQSVGWVVSGLSCPMLTGWGASNPSGCRGSTLTFGASATGGTGVQWRWLKNGVPLANGTQPSGSVIAGATTNSMTLSNYSPGDGGNYQVGVSSAGACETLSSNINEPDPFASPTILNNPGDVAACINASPSLFAAANPGVGSALYRWQRLVTAPNTYADIVDGPTGNGSTYFGTGTTTFSIFGAQVADTNRYRCRIQDSVCGAATQVFTTSALITINPNTSVIVDPQPQTVCPGASFVFFTVVADPVGQGFTYQWQRHQPPAPNVYVDINNGPSGFGGTISGAQTSFLGISTPLGGDFDRYRCVVTGPCGFPATSNNAMLSSVQNPIVTSGPTVVPGCAFGTASMSITATPAGSTYQWQQYVGPCILCYVDDADGPTGNGGTYSGSQTPTLSINGFAFFDTFTAHRCLVTPPCPNMPTAASALVNFTITDPPAIQTQPVGGLVCPNGTRQASVTLQPGNYGTLTYQWWRYVPAFPIYAGVPNGGLPSGAIASGANTATLTISNFKAQDTGQYYCKVIGDCGSIISSVVTLTHCPGDFNCSGTLEVADIFAFLNAWFAGAPGADVDGINGLQVADIFYFLNAWFAGC